MNQNWECKIANEVDRERVRVSWLVVFQIQGLKEAALTAAWEKLYDRLGFSKSVHENG